MLAQKSNRKWLTSQFARLFCILFLLVFITACTTGAGQPLPNLPSLNGDPESLPQAEITFEVQLLNPLEEGQNLYVEILDEVTGLALNPTHVRMEAVDANSYTVKIPFTVGSDVKYRYVRDNDPIGTIEYNSLNQQVRYRLLHVDGPGTVNDVVSAWKNRPFNANSGRISGQVAAIGSNAPVVNALVVSGGIQTLTASDGSFLLEGLPPGTHNLVVYSMDGSYRTFQQGAVVAPNSTTPAFIQMSQADTVNVTFVTRLPENIQQGTPVRMVGNIYSLGNSFADLRGGVSVVASRAPLMTLLPDGTYTLTLRLPVGFDLRYKYTLGDGFWNAEHRADGGFELRQLIVPNEDITIEDQVATFGTAGMEPISFTVTVPENTPITDTVSIQFNPYGWTEPIPMWPLGGNRWFYILHSPLDLLSNATYRYCRNEQCGAADAEGMAGANAKGLTLTPSGSTQTIEDTISSWAWWGESGSPIVVSAATITPRNSNFMAGVEFIPDYDPSWQPYFTWAYQNLTNIGSNTVILSPTWHLTHQNPPVIEPVPGKDPLWNDLLTQVSQARQNGLDVVIHPSIQLDQDAQEWWSGAERDANWWQSWFDRYRVFILYYADLASQTGARALILNDENMLPSLPGASLSNGTPPGVPGDAADRWRRLIAEVRVRYTGQLIWMIPFDGNTLADAPEFINDVDQVYVRLSTGITDVEQPTQADLEAGFAAILDEQILPLQEQTNLPVILGLLYPSLSGGASGCIAEDGGCELLQPGIEAPSGELDLRLQAEIYSSALTVVNQRSWISGFIAGGYYPPVALKDQSTSVRNKPAADVLWYWYPRLLGQAQ